jgi:hypothetical protein
MTFWTPRALQSLLCLALLAAGVGIAGPAHADTVADQHLLTQLGLVRGHLSMARELTDAAEPKQASLHYHHPLKEIYGSIESELIARGIPELGGRLQLLESVADQHGDVRPALKEVMATIDLAEATISASPKLMLGSVLGLLEHAAIEYAAAYPGEALANLEEYQDSRGFVRKATEIFARIEPALAQKAPESTRAIAGLMDQLQSAWPSVAGPVKPELSAREVHALVAKIAQRASMLLR